MKILKSNIQSKIKQASMCTTPDSQIHKMQADVPFAITGYVLYEDFDKTLNEERKFLSIEVDGAFYNSGSPTLLESFESNLAILDDSDMEVTEVNFQVLKSKSANDRDFWRLRMVEK